MAADQLDRIEKLLTDALVWQARHLAQAEERDRQIRDMQKVIYGNGGSGLKDRFTKLEANCVLVCREIHDAARDAREAATEAAGVAKEVASRAAIVAADVATKAAAKAVGKEPVWQRILIATAPPIIIAILAFALYIYKIHPTP